MQIVGRACEVCAQKIVSELDGVGCERCRRFFHDACLASPPSEETDTKGYRSPTKKRRKQSVVCPGCGVDLRRELQERNQASAAVREAYDEDRRVRMARGVEPGTTSWRLGRALISIGVLFFILLVRYCTHR